MQVDFSNHRFRCSSLGHIMTEPQGDSNMDKYLKAKAISEKLKGEYDAMNKVDKKGAPLKSAENKLASLNKKLAEVAELDKIKHQTELSESCKTHLVDIYVKEKYGRQTDISNKYIEKGLMVEEDAITLFSLVKNIFFRKNETHLKNDFIMGTPDLFEGECIENADVIIDTKSSWDIYSFFRNLTKKVNPLYYWQLQGYMDLSGAKQSLLAYCLVNTPEIFLIEEKRRLFYRMNAVTEQNPDYMEACTELEKSMLYDDISIQERLIEIPVERNEDDIARMHKRVVECRKYLAELQEKLSISELVED